MFLLYSLILSFGVDNCSNSTMLVESYYHDRRYPICPYTLPQIYDRVCKDNTTTTITWTCPYEKYTIHQIYEQVRNVHINFILCESSMCTSERAPRVHGNQWSYLLRYWKFTAEIILLLH